MSSYKATLEDEGRFEEARAFARAIGLDPKSNNVDPRTNFVTKPVTRRRFIEGETKDGILYNRSCKNEGRFSAKSLGESHFWGLKICHFVHGVNPASAIFKERTWQEECGKEKRRANRSIPDSDGLVYRYFFFDLDGKDKSFGDYQQLSDELKRIGLWPYVTAIVETSPNKFHLYLSCESVVYAGYDIWSRKEFSAFTGWPKTGEVDRYLDIWDLFNRYFQGDAVHDIMRIASTPGYTNVKNGWRVTSRYTNSKAIKLSLDEAEKLAWKVLENNRAFCRSAVNRKAAKTTKERTEKATPVFSKVLNTNTAYGFSQTKKMPKKPLPDLASLVYNEGLHLDPTYCASRDLSGHRNNMLLLLSRPAFKYIDLDDPEQCLFYFNTIIRPFFEERTSKDLRMDNELVTQYANFLALCRKTAEKFASQPPPASSRIPKPKVIADNPFSYKSSGAKTEEEESKEKERFEDEQLNKIRFQIITYLESVGVSEKRIDWLRILIHEIALQLTDQVLGYHCLEDHRVVKFFIPVDCLKTTPGIGKYQNKLLFLESLGILERRQSSYATAYSAGGRGLCKVWTLFLPREDLSLSVFSSFIEKRLSRIKGDIEPTVVEVRTPETLRAWKSLLPIWLIEDKIDPFQLTHTSKYFPIFKSQYPKGYGPTPKPPGPPPQPN